MAPMKYGHGTFGFHRFIVSYFGDIVSGRTFSGHQCLLGFRSAGIGTALEGAELASPGSQGGSAGPPVAPSMAGHGRGTVQDS
jgi:hypothetical protein